MANYQYIARTTGGERVTGVMQADNEASVLRTLDEQKMFPVQVTEAKPKGVQAVVGVKKKVKAAELGMAYGQLADLLGSGVPMLRALQTLVDALGRGALRDSVAELARDVGAGKSMVEAMGDQPEVYPTLHMAMVRAGERGGFLEQVLLNLSTFLERQDELRSRVMGAMIYPVILMIMGTGALVFILLVLVPNFEPMFEGVDLPLPTVALFTMSDSLTRFWPLILAGLVGAMIGSWSWAHSERGKRQWDYWRLKIPVAGKAMRMVSITRFCRILGTMLMNDVPILQALAISKGATGSVLLGESIGQAEENVRAGQPLTEPLRGSGLFPMEVLEMIAVAEESNQLERVLVKIADTVEKRTDRQVDHAVKLIEPLLLVGLAGSIAFMAMGLLIPIFEMAKTMK